MACELVTRYTRVLDMEPHKKAPSDKSEGADIFKKTRS